MERKAVSPVLFCLDLLVLPFYGMAQCSPVYYKKLLKEADQKAFGKNPDYELAINKLLPAKTCQPDSEAVLNVQLVWIKPFTSIRSALNKTRIKHISTKNCMICCKFVRRNPGSARQCHSIS